MKRVPRILFILLLLTVLSGCYIALPNYRTVNMTPLQNMPFMIISDTASNFQWYLDGTPQTGKTTSYYDYWVFDKDVGPHTIEVRFTDAGKSQSETWAVIVSSSSNTVP